MIEQNSQDATGWFARGKMRFEKGEHDLAIADLDQSLTRNPSSSEALAIRGFAWKRKGDKKKALADFNRAIEQSRIEDYRAQRPFRSTWR